MRKISTLVLIMSLCLSSCSKSDGEDSSNPEAEIPDTEAKYISKMGGGDDTVFEYGNNLLLKGIDNTSGIFFQVEYNSENKVNKVYTCECGWPENGMDYDIPTEYPDSYRLFNYHYDNDKLVKITSEAGKLLVELKYSAQDQVIEFYEAREYSEVNNYYDNVQYIYDNNGKIESYVSYSSYDESTNSGRIETDNKVNPLHVFWQNYGLIIPDDISEISTYNIPFFPNNVTEIYDGEELISKTTMTYVDNYPVFYEEIFSRGDGVTIEYFEQN